MHDSPSNAAWERRRIEDFILGCIEAAQEHERQADQLRGLAAKVASPPPDTRIELTSRADTILFVKEIAHAS